MIAMILHMLPIRTARGRDPLAAETKADIRVGILMCQIPIYIYITKIGRDVLSVCVCVWIVRHTFWHAKIT